MKLIKKLILEIISNEIKINVKLYLIQNLIGINLKIYF